jgi:hypothetical protein
LVKVWLPAVLLLSILNTVALPLILITVYPVFLFALWLVSMRLCFQKRRKTLAYIYALRITCLLVLTLAHGVTDRVSTTREASTARTYLGCRGCRMETT